MTSKRTLLQRERREPITREAIELYARGCALQTQGQEANEFRAIDKRLNWTLLKRAPHEVSVFEDLGGDPPGYMQARNSAAHPDFNGWFSGRDLKHRLQVSLDARR
jgi:hypothetical protein